MCISVYDITFTYATAPYHASHLTWGNRVYPDLCTSCLPWPLCTPTRQLNHISYRLLYKSHLSPPLRDCLVG